MALRKRPPSVEPHGAPDAVHAPHAAGFDVEGPALEGASLEATAAPRTVQGMRSLQARVGNRAAARLVASRPPAEAGAEDLDRIEIARSPVFRRQLSSSIACGEAGVQRAFTAKDAEGTEYTEVDDLVTESRLAVNEHLSAIETADPDDFNGVYGNYLENAGVFDHYLRTFYDSGGNYGQFDLASAGDVVKLYFYLKKWVMRDAAGSGEDEAPIHPDFTPDQILFASISGGKVGSIYFPMGRIRLVHGGGPEVAICPGVVRYTISDQDYQAYWKTHGSASRITQLRSCKPAKAGEGERLVEFWPGKRHPSRGGPMPFTYSLTQTQLNIIYRAAMTHSNSKFKEAMAADPGLAQIPTN